MKLKEQNHNFLVECEVCGHIKKSSPIPDGDELCPCGEKEMGEYEGELTEELSKLLDWEED